MKNVPNESNTLREFKNMAKQCTENVKFPDEQVHFKGYCIINIELIIALVIALIKTNLIYSTYICKLLIR